MSSYARYDKKKTLQIKSDVNQFGNGRKVLKQSIYIRKKAKLRIDEDLILANNVEIILAPKSKLEIDGATIKRSDERDKSPITIIEEKKYLFFFKRRRGKVKLINGGKLLQ